MEFDFDAIEEDPDSQDEIVEKLLDFLVTWLITHIMKVDMLYTK